MLKKLSLSLVALLVLTACGGGGDTAATEDNAASAGVTTTEAVGTDSGSGIQTDVELSWEVSGNSVSVFIKDAQGNSCVDSENPDCAGFYISWEANFDYLTKSIDYADPIVINDLVAGDIIDFQLMYQEVAGAAEVVEVKRYPFAFNG